VKEDEWDTVKNWMWNNRDAYNGIAILPYNDHAYVQAPFEDCDEETYLKLVTNLTKIDLTQVWETEDTTNFESEAACAGGTCEIDFVYEEDNADK
jgi:ribonucleoside-diphosphate reductase alpha chain